MALYSVIFDMANDPTLKKQVTVACRIAANNILNELATAPNHVNRMVWARNVLDQTGQHIFDKMMSIVSLNATLQAAAPGPYLDSDIQFIVNSNVDTQYS